MRRILMLGLVVSASACNNDDGYTTYSAHLLPLADCTAAANYVKQVATDAMNKRIDLAIETYDNGNGCYGGGYGGESDGAGGSGGTADDDSGGGGGPTTGTGTNNQVAGVDEADFVKNDGQYIYLAQNGVLRIVDAWPANQTHTVSTTPLEGTPKKLFVEGDKALVYTANTPESSWYRECTYGYDCDFTGDGSDTRVLVYDISDRSAPILERTLDLGGSLIAARRIGSTVHTVITKASNPFGNLDLELYLQGPEASALCAYGTPPTDLMKLQAHALFNEMRERNALKIAAQSVELLVPSITDSANPTLDGAPTCGTLYASPIADSTAFTSIVSVGLESTEPAQTATIFSRPGAVYASSDALYIAVGRQSYTADTSTIHKFQISDGAAPTAYLASGEVAGRALNQFAMDEHEGNLRIATTDGRAPSPDANSHMTVLQQFDTELVALGHIGGIAPSEDIRSVRFDGDHAFVVTFKKTDPLYAFDLSSPWHPVIKGELKIPGFSTYMHMLDSKHLLTIGYDADDHGSFAYFDGVMLQIFDVTNMSAPTLAHKHIIGTRGSSSEALTNHLAFTWYPEKRLLSLPMTLCEGGDDGNYGQNMTFNGLMVFDTSANLGFSEHGRVPHAVSQGISCGNWWTNASSSVKRSLFLDNFVYSISDVELKVRNANALSSELVTVPLQ